MMLVRLLLPVVVVTSSLQNYDGVLAASPVPTDDSENLQQFRGSNLTADNLEIPETPLLLPALTSGNLSPRDEAIEVASQLASNIENAYQSSKFSDDIPWDLIGIPRRRTNKVLVDPWTKVSSTQSILPTDDQHISTSTSASSEIETAASSLRTQSSVADATVSKVQVNSTNSSGYSDESQLSDAEIVKYFHSLTSAEAVKFFNISADSSTPGTYTEQKDVTSPQTTQITTTTTDAAFNLEPPYFSRNPQPIFEHHEDEMFHRIEFDPNNPYSHWDSDSEEQEREMELQRLQDEPEIVEERNMSVQISSSPGDEEAEEDSKGPSTSPPLTGRSYLLLLAGNSTIVKLRQKDFAKYLKLNLAARLSLEYDDVRVNRVVLAPPQLLVNVSLVTPAEPVSENTPQEAERLDDNVMKEEAPLHMLAETNATLLELSGEEYHVVRLLPLRANPPTPESEDDDEEDIDPVESSTLLSDHHGDVELVIYTAIGGACAIVIFATLLITFGKYLRVLEIPWPWRRPKSFPSTWNLPNGRLRHHRMGDEHLTATSGPPPTVIYSGSFAARAAAAAGASWVDDYQPQSNNEDSTLNTKMVPNNPMYADLEMGGNMMIKNPPSLYSDAETTSIISHHRPSPSKLHIFSCRPGSLLIPLPPHRVVRKNLVPPVAPNNAPNNQKKSPDTHPLDVRIGEDGHGHDNPNYQT